jgi:phosphohistidine phosphatase
MRRRLIVLRHAKSDWSDEVADHDRPLARRGRREAVLAGQWLHAHAGDIDLVVCSPATRARQTWKQVARQYTRAPELRVEERLYAATEHDLVVVLKQLPAPLRTVLLVGHNPGLEDLVAHLTGVWCPLKTSSIAVLTSRSAWADARFRWGRLDTSVTPRA